MTTKKKLVHPNFILGLSIYALFFISAFLITNDIVAGKMLAVLTLVMGGIHWMWGLRDAWTDRDLENKEVGNFFWFVSILLIPPLAGLMYYMVNDKRVSL
ncbi:MAG: hypothetical protein EOP48_19435 [Sphingobacteriales bacterium]|nr:MAG: hypothetical protein EOP48_19435 [Sphingobacteriales bacterium]